MITTERGPGKSSEDGAAEFCAIQLIESINVLVNQQEGQPQLVLHDVMRAIMKCPSAVAVSYFERDAALGFRPATPLICRKSAAHLAGDWEPVLTRVVMESGRRGGVCGETLGNGAYEVAATVVGNAADPEGILAVFTLGERQEQFSKLFVQLIAEKLGTRQRAHAGPTAADALATLLLSLPADDTNSAFQQLADELVRLLDVDTVFIGARHGQDRGRLQAISGKRAFKRPSPATTVVDELISECLLRDAPRMVTAKSADVTAAEAAFLHQFEAQRAVLVPAQDSAGQSCGAVLLLEREIRRRPADLRQDVDRLVGPTGQVLSFIIQHQPTTLTRLGRRVRKMMGGPGTLIAVVAVLLLGLIPMPVRVACDVELRPVTRRYVAAPHEGLLRDVLVQPGDVVAQGQVMARMDRREAELQLASLKAQYVGARKRRDTSLATRDRAETQISKLEMERLQAQMDLVERRLQHLEIRAPLDGVVLAGDPRDLEGARITLGQSLFETGPLKQMLAELWVEGADIARIHPEQKVSLRLEADPHRVIRGRVSRVAPRADIRDGRSVFIAWVTLENEEGRMRPGMVGQAKVSTQRAPCLWSLLRKPVHAIATSWWL